MKIFLASSNKGKIERYRKLLAYAGADVEICTPADLGLERIDVAETGDTLAENAELKARAYFGKVDLPILANDTGFYVEGEGFVMAPKRFALNGVDEAVLTSAERGSLMAEFWKDIARKHGGKVDAEWREIFVLLNPDGKLQSAEAKRLVTLTDNSFGRVHEELPIRALYISKATNKPAAHHTAEEEQIELKPVVDALIKLLGNLQEK